MPARHKSVVRHLAPPGACLLVALLLGHAPAVQARDSRMAGEAWIGASALHTGSLGAMLTFAPVTPNDRPGWRVQGVAQRGYYRYALNAAPQGVVRGRYSDVSVLLGYEHNTATYGFMAALGPSLYTKDLSYRSPGDGAGSKLGAKATVSGYVSAGQALSGFALASYSSANRTKNLYANLGIGLPHGLSTGPEFAWMQAPDYREARVGMHLSGIRAGPLQASLSLGRVRNQDGQQARHVGVNARMTF